MVPKSHRFQLHFLLQVRNLRRNWYVAIETSSDTDLHLHQLDELPPLLNLLLNQTVELSDVVLSVNDKEEHAYLVHQKEFEGGKVM